VDGEEQGRDRDTLHPQVREYEPVTALFAGPEEGLWPWSSAMASGRPWRSCCGDGEMWRFGGSAGDSPGRSRAEDREQD
jgi:hypothetical protein